MPSAVRSNDDKLYAWLRPVKVTANDIPGFEMMKTVGHDLQNFRFGGHHSESGSLGHKLYLSDLFYFVMQYERFDSPVHPSVLDFVTLRFKFFLSDA